jgi:hypothetical protein
MKFKMLEKVSFRLSEQTSFDHIVKQGTRFSLRHDEVVVLLSQTEDQLIFVSGYTPLDDGAKVLTSRRLRLTKGTWDALRLKEYARNVGLTVTDWSVLDKSMRKARRVVATAARRALKAA